jgi:two-component system OmpR family response regulator
MEEKLKIFLCEDDENLGMLLREYLQAKGFDTDLFPDGEAGFKGFVKTKYDLCIVDVMMPKKDGVTLVKEIRQINSEIPVIFLTAKNMKEDVLEGFKAGADDYITKPFSMEELVLRIEAIIRRVKGKKSKEQQVYSFGSMMFDTQKQILTIGDIQTKLTTKESELLSLLCAHANDILERNHALKQIVKVFLRHTLVFCRVLYQYFGGDRAVCTRNILTQSSMYRNHSFNIQSSSCSL